MVNAFRLAGVILAGGQSRRMGRDKALLPWRGLTLIEHVAARLAGQVDVMAISANGDPKRFAALDLVVARCAVLPDADGSHGPLSGIRAALAFAQDEGATAVLVAPCDAPFMPEDLAARLGAALSPGVLAVCATSRRGLEPLFSLWRTDAREAVETALTQGGGAVRGLLANLPHALVPFEGSDAFANLNTPDDMDRLGGGP